MEKRGKIRNFWFLFLIYSSVILYRRDTNLRNISKQTLKQQALDDDQSKKKKIQARLDIFCRYQLYNHYSKTFFKYIQFQMHKFALSPSPNSNLVFNKRL